MRNRLELDLLQSFLMVCKLGSFSRAAEKLFISQPALTRKIQLLEEILGCRLIERSKRYISLTESGYLLQMRAQEILELANATVAELSETGEFLSGTVRIGCVESKALEVVADIIKTFRAQYPHANVDFYVADGDGLRSRLDADQLDMVVLLEPIEAAKYTHLSLKTDDRWVAAMLKKDMPKGKTSITAKELIARPLILPRRYIVLDELFEVLKTTPKELDISAYHNLPSAGIALVKAGLGTMLCVEGSFDTRGEMDIDYLPITPIVVVKHVLARRKNKPLPKAAEVFWSLFEKRKEIRTPSKIEEILTKSKVV